MRLLRFLLNSMFNKNQNSDQSQMPPRKKLLFRILISCAALGTGLVLAGALVVILAMTLIYPKLPPMDQLTDYHPKMPLRIYTADSVKKGAALSGSTKFRIS